MGCGESKPIPQSQAIQQTQQKPMIQPIQSKPVIQPIPQVKPKENFSFEDNVLRFHNQAREQAGLGPLSWSKKLEQKSRDWGEFLKQKEECKIRHPLNSDEERKKYVPGTTGQNLYVAHGYPNDPSSGLDAVQKWYSECKDYKKPLEGQELPENFMGVGHFTQMMWEDAKEVGCARIDCPKNIKDNRGNVVEAKGSIVVCDYDSGNVGGQFQEKVPDNVKCQGENLWIGA